MSVTIPGRLHESMVLRYKEEYEMEFGRCDGSTVTYTRDAYIDKYARDIVFWRRRLPAIGLDERPSMEVICTHAIASNAIANMERAVRARGVYDEVAARVEQLREEPGRQR